MKNITTIIKSSIEPNKEHIWLHNGKLKWFGSNGWEEIGTKSNVLDSTEYPTLDTNSPSNNCSVIKELGLNKHSSVRLITREVSGTITGDTIGNYYNGHVSILSEDHILTYNVDFNSGNITLLSDQDTSKSLPYIPLDIGTTEEVKSANLDKLFGVQGHFFTQLDYGYGVGTWTSGVGGHATVTTAYGHEVFFDISNDGSIIRDDSYIKPDQPYRVLLSSSDINTTLDDVTANAVYKAGEIVISGSTGPITYTRNSDSTVSNISFSDTTKSGNLSILTYNNNTKKITASTLQLVTKEYLDTIISNLN